MATFERGTGDAIVTYENELRLQRQRPGAVAEYVVPPATLLIEGPAALVDAVVERHGSRAVAEAFLTFLHSPRAQAIFAEYGFRPIHEAPGEQRHGLDPLPPRVFTMADLGGWKRVNKQVYAPGGVWDSLFIRAERARNADR
jgi:sulfate transport system substrate-binding protein